MADRGGQGGASARRVQSVTAGRTVELEGWSECRGVGAAFVVCNPTQEGLATVVIDASGRRTAFQDVVAVPDPDPRAGVGYYWAVAGRFQGFLDEDGTWVYRERRSAEPQQ